MHPIRQVCSRCGGDVVLEAFTQFDDRYGTGVCLTGKRQHRTATMGDADPAPRVQTIRADLYPDLDARRKLRAERRRLLRLVVKGLQGTGDPKLAARIQKARARLDALGVKWS
jgi:hypothetical protein